MSTQTPRPLTPKEQVKQFLRAEIDARPEIKIDEVVEATVQQFIGDPTFVMQWFRSSIKEWLGPEVRTMIGRDRDRAILVDGTIIARSQVSEVLARRRQAINSTLWRERTSTSYKSIDDMTRVELLEAIAGREKAIRTATNRMNFMKALEERMRGARARKTVKDVFTQQQLEEIASACGLILSAVSDEPSDDQSETIEEVAA